MLAYKHVLAVLISYATLSTAFQLKSDYIYTEDVAYCSTGRAVEVERFDIKYYRENKTVGFDLSARSVAADLAADLNIQLFAYGKTRINLTVNLCNVLQSALCPLPEYQFDGSFQYLLPDSVDIDLPELAWTVPDLDASATVIMTNLRDGSEALCLSATLSNGKTVYTNQVGWALGGLALGAFLVALIHSFWPLSPFKSGPEWRFATILTYFQHVALCGFLSLDYPKVYKNFTLNFAWAQGLIYIGPINSAINNMRYKTGGINRSGQTYTVTSEDGFTPISFARSYASAAVTVPTVQAAPSYNLISGIETTAEFLGITYPNAFMTVFIVFLLLLALILSIIVVATLATTAYSLIKHKKTAHHNLKYFIWTNILRIALISYGPIVLFVFWQFLHLSESGWLAVFIAALTLVWIHLAIFGIWWHVSKIANRAFLNMQDNASIRDGRTEGVSLRWTTVSQQFKRSGFGYLILIAAGTVVSAAFVAFAQGHGLVQLIPLIVVEVITFISFCIWRPFANKGSNALMIFLSLFKIVAYGILIPFYVGIEVDGIIEAVLGFVLIAVQGVMVVVLFIVTLYNLGVGILWSRNSSRKAKQQQMIAEKLQHMKEKPAASQAPLLTSQIRENENEDPFIAPPVSGLYIPPSSPQPSEDRTIVQESPRNSDVSAPKRSSRLSKGPMFWRSSAATVNEQPQTEYRDVEEGQRTSS